MLFHVTEHHLFLLQAAEAQLADVVGLPTIGLIDAHRQRIGPSTGAAVRLRQACLHQSFQRLLGLRGFALDVGRQFIGTQSLQLTQRGQCDQAVDGQLAPLLALLLHHQLQEGLVGVHRRQT